MKVVVTKKVPNTVLKTILLAIQVQSLDQLGTAAGFIENVHGEKAAQDHERHPNYNFCEKAA